MYFIYNGLPTGDEAFCQSDTSSECKIYPELHLSSSLALLVFPKADTLSCLRYSVQNQRIPKNFPQNR